MNTALLVIDMQNDYLGERRKSRFPYDTAKLVASVNALIRRYHEGGREVIYVRHLIHNLPSNRLLFGYSLAGTEGAQLYSGLDIVSEHCFDKYIANALSNNALRALLRERGCDTIHLCGLDECGCVASSALGAKRRGIRAEILREGVATVFPKSKVLMVRDKLNRYGIKYL